MTFGTRKNIFLSLTIRSGMVLALLAGMLSGFPPTAARAAGTINLSTSTYSEDFNTLVNTGTSTTVPTGWDFAESGTNANTTYAAGTGSNNAGNTYSFGAAVATERAFGGLQSGTLVPTIGASFTNNTGAEISALQISYAGEQWRLGAIGRVDRLDFQYSLDATSLITGIWTDGNSLDFTAPVTAGTVGALDGNLAANRSAISASITGLNIANGSTFWIRWQDFNATGADDGLAVDDFSLIVGSLPTVTTFAATTVTASGATLNGTVNANNLSTTVTFEYGLTTAYGSTITAAESPVIGSANTAASAAISGLLPNTIYHYRAVGVNIGGTTNGLDQTFTTPALSVSITTEVHTAAHAQITVAAVGDSLHAKATVTGSGPAATGSVTFFAFDNPSCSGTGTHVGMVGLVIGGVAEPSQSAVLTINGLSFRAHYNGDPNYAAVDGGCQTVSATPYPTVLTLSAYTSPQDGALLTVGPSNLLVQFSMDVLHGNPLDSHSAENTTNYLLVSPGATAHSIRRLVDRLELAV